MIKHSCIVTYLAVFNGASFPLHYSKCLTSVNPIVSDNNPTLIATLALFVVKINLNKICQSRYECVYCCCWTWNPRRVARHRVMSRCIMSCRVVSRGIASCCVASCRMVPQIMTRRVVSRDIASCRVASFRVVSLVMPRRVVSRGIASRCVASCRLASRHIAPAVEDRRLRTGG